MSKRIYRFTVPYPPTVNHMYGRTKFGREYIKPEGIAFIAAVESVLGQIIQSEPGFEPLTGRLIYRVNVWHPEAVKVIKRRDITNLQKILDDSITKAGFWEDDEFLDLASIRRKGWEKEGRCEIVIMQVDKKGMREQAQEKLNERLEAEREKRKVRKRRLPAPRINRPLDGDSSQEGSAHPQ